MNRFAPKALQKPAQSLEKSPAAKFGITNMTKSPESTEHTGLPHFGDISSIQLDESDISSIKDELFVSEESYLQP